MAIHGRATRTAKLDIQWVKKGFKDAHPVAFEDIAARQTIISEVCSKTQAGIVAVHVRIKCICNQPQI